MHTHMNAYTPTYTHACIHTCMHRHTPPHMHIHTRSLAEPSKHSEWNCARTQRFHWPKKEKGLRLLSGHFLLNLQKAAGSDTMCKCFGMCVCMCVFFHILFLQLFAGQDRYPLFGDPLTIKKCCGWEASDWWPSWSWKLSDRLFFLLRGFYLHHFRVLCV